MWHFEQNDNVFDWPVLSADINSIKNIWGILIREVYYGKQQDSTKEL